MPHQSRVDSFSQNIGIAKSIVAGLACASYLYYGFYKMLVSHYGIVGGDFLIGCYAIRGYLDGKGLYEVLGGRNPIWYPPLGMTQFIPLCLLDLNVAKAIWFFLCHILVFSTAWLVYKSCSSRNGQLALFSVLVSFGFSMPLQSLIQIGNNNVLVLLAMGLAFFLQISQRNTTLLLGIFSYLTWLKVYPAGFLLPYAWNAYWGQFARYGAITLGFGFLSVAIFGLHTHLEFLYQLPEIYRYVGPILGNVSFTHLLRLHFGLQPGFWMQLITFFSYVALVGLCWQAGARIRASKEGGPTLIVDTLTMIMVTTLAVPSAWGFFHAYLVVPQSVMLFLWLCKLSRPKHMGLFLIISAAINWWEILAYQLPLTPAGLTIRQIGVQRDQFPLLYPLFYSFPFFLAFGMYLWFLMNYAEIHRGLRQLQWSVQESATRP